MKRLHELYGKLETKKMTLLAARPGNKKLEFLSDMILYYGLDKDKSITIYLTEDKYWFHNHLLSHLNEVDSYQLEKYLYPCIYNYGSHDFDRRKFLENIDKLHGSNITIESLKNVEDTVDYIIEKENSNPSDIAIIYNIEDVFTNGYRSPKEVLDNLKLIKDTTQIVLVSGVNRTAEEKDEYDFNEIHYYRELEPYIDEVILLRMKNSQEYVNTRTIIVSTLDSSFEMTYDLETERFE